MTRPDSESIEVLPEWAIEWSEGRCRCGARLVRPACMYGDRHLACSGSGVNPVRCDRQPSRDVSTPDLMVGLGERTLGQRKVDGQVEL